MMSDSCEEEESCVICDDVLVDTDTLWACHHCKQDKFHQECMLKWLNISDTCPLCKGWQLTEPLEGERLRLALVRRAQAMVDRHRAGRRTPRARRRAVRMMQASERSGPPPPSPSVRGERWDAELQVYMKNGWMKYGLGYDEHGNLSDDVVFELGLAQRCQVWCRSEERYLQNPNLIHSLGYDRAGVAEELPAGMTRRLVVLGGGCVCEGCRNEEE